MGRHKHVKTVNGKPANGIAGPSFTALTAEEKIEIKYLAELTDKKKALLGDALYKLMGQGAFDLIKDIHEAQTRLETAAANLLKKRGLDPTDPKKGKWNLNTETLILTRVE